LLADGLFDAERKRALPAFPKCLGIITSPTGAVIRDIMTVVRRRHARLNLLVYPATMQGPSAPASVIAGIRWFNANPSLVDVIVLARGGGSLEDLAGFNDEELAREIVASDLAIVSAIGHETDFTIADFAADLRAPTPSAAAELITAAQHRIEERVAALGARVHRAGSFHLMQARQSYVRLSAESVLSRVRDDISRRHQHIDELSFRMNASARHRLRVGAQQLAHIDQRLHNQDVISRIATVHRRLQAVDYRLRSAAAKILVKRQARLNRASAGMRALSPLAVLSRGYSLIYAADGKLLRSAADTAPGEIIRARLADGTLEAEVKQTNIDEAKDMETKHS
jgi:exodeoxyribonuclease VII large subunit